MDTQVPSILKRQATDALRRARKLPIGPERNDLRQLAIGLQWLERKGLAEKVASTGVLPLLDERRGKIAPND
jgi:hypothetical protein